MKTAIGIILIVLATASFAQTKYVLCRKMGDLGSGQVYTFENFCPIGYYQVG